MLFSLSIHNWTVVGASPLTISFLSAHTATCAPAKKNVVARVLACAAKGHSPCSSASLSSGLAALTHSSTQRLPRARNTASRSQGHRARRRAQSSTATSKDSPASQEVARTQSFCREFSPWRRSRLHLRFAIFTACRIFSWSQQFVASAPSPARVGPSPPGALCSEMATPELPHAPGKQDGAQVRTSAKAPCVTAQPSK
jgi:hypothetical protein